MRLHDDATSNSSLRISRTFPLEEILLYNTLNLRGNSRVNLSLYTVIVI